MTTKPGWPILYGNPTIQKRVSIARPPALPTEDSDVLVLNSRSTSPDPSNVRAEVLYLDLRLSLPITGSGSINWAFAGLRETVQLDEVQDNATRYHWKHAIDSHVRKEPPDEGTMVRSEGESGESIEVETGVGIDPETGNMGPYEEVWKCVQLVDIPQNSAYLFLLPTHQDPDQSIRFMGVLGSHAMGLWQLEIVADERSSAMQHNEPQHFHAVRLRIESKNHQKRDVKLGAYSKVFSTGYQALEDQLGKLVEGLMTREVEGKSLWKRGEELTLGDSQGRALTWTVWDAGHVDN